MIPLTISIFVIVVAKSQIPHQQMQRQLELRNIHHLNSADSSRSTFRERHTKISASLVRNRSDLFPRRVSYCLERISFFRLEIAYFKARHESEQQYRRREDERDPTSHNLLFERFNALLHPVPIDIVQIISPYHKWIIRILVFIWQEFLEFCMYDFVFRKPNATAPIGRHRKTCSMLVSFCLLGG